MLHNTIKQQISWLRGHFDSPFETFVNFCCIFPHNLVNLWPWYRLFCYLAGRVFVVVICLFWLVNTKWGQDLTHFTHRCWSWKCHWWQLLYFGRDQTVIVCHLLCRPKEILKVWNKICLRMSFNGLWVAVSMKYALLSVSLSPCLPPYSIATVWLFFLPTSQIHSPEHVSTLNSVWSITD